MAFVHKLIQGGEQWLPFALSRLRQLAGLGLGYASQRFSMPDGSDVSVRVAGAQHFVHIGGGACYEFFTSEPVSPTTMSTAEFTGGLDDFGVTGSGVRMVGLQADPLFSSSLTPAVPPSWVLRAKDFILQSVSKPISENFRSLEAWQTQKFFAYVTWPGNGSKSMVTSPQALLPGRNSMANWDSPYRDSAWDNQGPYLHDEGLDVPPTYYDAKGMKSGQPSYGNAAVWQRHAAVQIVAGRSFFICTDNYGRFQVYPVKAYPVVDGRPYATSYWLETPPYPTWVTIPSPTDANVRLNEWHWAFNKDATKAVCCPFHSETDGLQIIERATNRAKSLDYALTYNAAVLPEELSLLTPGVALRPGRIDTPGLVEFGIEIVVTGPGEMDFTVAFTLLRNRYALDANGRYFFDAAYALKDMSDRAADVPAAWAEDVLVTAEIALFAEPGNYDASPLPSTNPDPSGAPSVFVENLNGSVAYVILATNNDDMVATERQKLRVQGTSGSFLTLAGFQRNLGPSAATATGTGSPGYIDLQGFESWYNSRPCSAGITPPFVVAGSAPTTPSMLAPGRAPNAATDTFEFCTIHSLELRTLSLAYRKTDYSDGTQRAITTVYNRQVDNRVLSTGWPVSDGSYDTAAAATERVPSSSVRHYDHVLCYAIWTDVGTGFNIHPAGHWSHYGLLDNISTKTGATSRHTTHRTLFNKAFDQTRAYSYYDAPYPGPLTETNAKAYSDYWLGNLGGFRTQGIWVTF